MATLTISLAARYKCRFDLVNAGLDEDELPVVGVLEEKHIVQGPSVR